MPASFSVWRWMVRSLWHFRRVNAAMLLGVMVGTAVIGGALIVGDSVRASLRQMTLDRLGRIDVVITGPRFFRERLVDDLQRAWSSEPGGPTVAPAIVLVGSVEHQTPTGLRRASKVNVYGVDQRAWSLIASPSQTPPSAQEALLNPSLAHALAVQPGDQLTVWLELPSTVPRDTLLGHRDNDTQELAVTVGNILPDAPGAARLGLTPTQQLPLNLFVNLESLQEALNLAEVKPTRRDPQGAPARVNTIFGTLPAGTSVERLTQHLAEHWQLADLNLRIVHDTTLNVLSVESTQLLLEDRFAAATLAYAEARGVPASPVMVYLANWIRNAREPQAYSMYSTVAGLDLLDLDEAFGPWEFLGPMPVSWGEEDVILNEFLAEDLKVQIGDQIRFAYHVVGSHGELPEVERTATVRGIVKLTGAAADKQLTPEVKGITDVDSLSDWDQPFPMDLDKVTARDDEYWNDYRATPKMFLRLATAQRLWPSRYGSLTSVRVAVPGGLTVEQARAELERYLLQTIDPHPLGLAFRDVKREGLESASGSTDFTGLFLGFSLFLIFSAMILVGLLFRLAIDQRVQQWGLLAAIGLPPQMVRQLLLGEAVLLVLLGSGLGCLAAVGYAQLLLYGLRTWWIGAIGTKFLQLAVHPSSLGLGACLAGGASFVAMVSGVRQLRGISLRAQMSGVSEIEGSSPAVARRAFWKSMLALGLAGLLIAGGGSGMIPSGEAFSGLSWPVVVFFLAGLLLLTGSLWSLTAWLAWEPNFSSAAKSLVQLGLKNASRRRQRSVLSTGLIATATFLITAVAAGHKDPTSERPERFSGNGGFTLVAEASRPILFDLNTAEGRKQLNLQARTPEQAAALQAMQVYAFRVQPGEDASCLNLFQTRAPTLLGAPLRFLERGGFKLIGGGDELWRGLNEELPPSSTEPRLRVYPALGDVNTLMFSLKKGVGDRLPYPAEGAAQRGWLQVTGMLDGSVFQGVLVISEEHFLRLYPERQGYQYFLIEVPREHAAAATDLLETELSEYGLDVEPVAERLARFLAVQNTYLSTFQTLGGFGLLLGTMGLATVMLRNVWERQAELALLRAVGLSSWMIGSLVLLENGWLLLWGLLAGSLSALLAMTPHVMSTGASVPWLELVGLLTAVFVVGCVAAGGAVKTAITLPIVTTLRGE